MKKNYLFVFLFLFSFCFSYGQAPLVKAWDKRFGGSDYEELACFQQTSDGGYILGGFSVSASINGDKTQASWGGVDYWIVKIDSLGNKQWDKRFGGTSDDFLYSLQQTIDEGYILGGYSSSGINGDKTQASWGGQDYWIVKIDSLGNKQWDKRFGGTGNEQVRSLQQTTDGGYILGGWSNSGISGDKTQAGWGGNDYWIVKIDSLGSKQWDKRFGGIDYDYLLSLQQATDGGYILGGFSYSAGISGDKTQANWGGYDFWILKIDSLSNKQWDKRFGGSSDDRLFSLRQTNDGGYILGGFSSSTISGDKTQANWGLKDYWIIKIDSIGNAQWDKDFGGTGDEGDIFGNISQTFDGGYLISGDSYSPISGNKTENNLGPEQTWVVKTDSIGNKLWDKTLITSGHDETGLAIQTKDGCYAMANWSNAGIGGYKTEANRDTTNNTYDYWIVKFCDTTQSVVPNSNFSSSDTSFCEEGGKCIDFTDLSTDAPTSWQWSFPGAFPNTSAQQNPTNICYIIPGTYPVTLIVSNASGSDTVSSAIVFCVGPSPPIVTGPHKLGDTLYASPSCTYQWYLDGVPIPGATLRYHITTVCGEYTVFIMDCCGCGIISNVPADPCTGVNELPGQSMHVYPNPAGDQLTIDNGQLTMGNTVMLKIFNVLGETLFSQYSQLTTPYSIDVSGFAKGIYLVEASDGETVFRAKFVKE